MKKAMIGFVIGALITLPVKKHPPVKESEMTKSELIDAIASGSKLTKADAG